MQSIVVEGKNRISGELEVQGAKNSALPILAATVLCDGETVLSNCPALTDVFSAERILTHLGCRCGFSDNTAVVVNDGVGNPHIPDTLMSEMRSSIIFLGAVLGKLGECTLSFPGGCELGARPIDMHLAALRRMGVAISEEFGMLKCRVEKELHGAEITLPFPSVGATENIILAGVLARGETVIRNAAREPEIRDVADFLNKCGADISGAGEGTVIIRGVKKLHGSEHRIMPDRIAAATYLSAAAITAGEVTLTGVRTEDLESVIPPFDEMGCYIFRKPDSIYIKAPKKLRRVKKIITLPHPGFPTDAQAVLMAVLCRAQGTSVITENIFESRFKHVPQLVKMGADIKVEGKAAIIGGVGRMFGTTVSATDLRGGAALVVAGLAAEGRTVVTEIAHIDRGYDEIERVLTSLGGKVSRI